MGYRQTRVAFHVLAALLHGRGRRHVSDLPDDVEVVHVAEAYRHQETVGIVLRSAAWEGPEEGGLIPEITLTIRDL